MTWLRRTGIGFGGFVAIAALTFLVWRNHGLDTMAKAGAVNLNGSVEQLRADFNANKDKVRLLFIVGPSCGTCLMGMDNLNRELVGKIQGDARFKTLVVHVPALAATAADVPGAMEVMNRPDVIHYWDGDARTGFSYAKVLNVYFAWDVWMAYAPGQTSDEPANPPKPTLWRHQLDEGPPAKSSTRPNLRPRRQNWRTSNEPSSRTAFDDHLSELRTSARRGDAGRRLSLFLRMRQL